MMREGQTAAQLPHRTQTPAKLVSGRDPGGRRGAPLDDSPRNGAKAAHAPAPAARKSLREPCPGGIFSAGASLSSSSPFSATDLCRPTGRRYPPAGRPARRKAGGRAGNRLKVRGATSDGDRQASSCTAPSGQSRWHQIFGRHQANSSSSGSPSPDATATNPVFDRHELMKALNRARGSSQRNSGKPHNAPPKVASTAHLPKGGKRDIHESLIGPRRATQSCIRPVGQRWRQIGRGRKNAQTSSGRAASKSRSADRAAIALLTTIKGLMAGKIIAVQACSRPGQARKTAAVSTSQRVCPGFTAASSPCGRVVGERPLTENVVPPSPTNGVREPARGFPSATRPCLSQNPRRTASG